MGSRIKKHIQNYNAASFFKRFLVMMLALVLMNFGIACYYQCGLGTDPFSVFVDGEHSLFHMTYGQVTNINNVFLFSFMLIFARKYIHVGSIAGALVSGTLIDAFNWLISTFFPCHTLIAQAVMLLTGLVVFAGSIALYISAQLGVSALEAIPLWLAEKTGVNLRWLRIAEDLTFMCIGILLGVFAGRAVFGDMIGIGTLAGAFGTGPVMKWFLNITDKRFQNWFGPLQKGSAALSPAGEAH